MFVYVLTTQGADTYADMAYLSMCTLRKNHKNAKIKCIVDEKSLKNIESEEHRIKSLVGEFIPVNVENKCKRYVNRYMKCRMRKIIDGKFLYLDADTLPVGELNSLFEIENSFAVASNHSRKIPKNFPSDERNVFVQNGWKIPQSVYINGGVMYWKDTNEAHNLAEKYIEKWMQCAGKEITTKDQPALNSALLEWEEDPTLLDNKYNAQFTTNPLSGIDAKIWHFYSSQGGGVQNHMEFALDRLHSDSFDVDSWISIVSNRRTPWLCRDRRSDSALASLMLRKGRRYNRREYLWANRRYIEWLKNVTKAQLSKLRDMTNLR